MEEKLSSIAKTLKPSPIQQLSFLAERCNAVNLAEGFPDFPAPPLIKAAAVSAITSDFNQYRHVQGICDLLVDKMKQMHGLDVDPLTDIAICCGQTEAFAATMFAIINPGDEVILFDPSFETYATCISMAGGVPVYVALDPPYWTLDKVKLLDAFTAKTKALVLNSPHNPTGKVFNMGELEIIAECCRTKDCIAITDEVYEHIIYDNEPHISLASLPGMQNRTVITSSLSKTYSVTGWRVGWAIGPSCIASAIRNIHTKVTDSAPAPFQEAALTALRSPPEYYRSLRMEYESKRDFVFKLLCRMGFQVEFKPLGSFFIFATIPETCKLTDVEFVEQLIKEAGVVAVPGCGFFHTKHDYDNRYIRFAFCKDDATLTSAALKMRQLVDASGRLRFL
ncbi:putative aminotransferase, class-I, pyridoxal-phosphate-binding, aminotransferase, class I/classII [Helianthus annuus]|uniref:Aminotransferase, class I/classII, pyridoxal phosphate-dependent transferase, major n=2 Tax=Helianthus annuus TaxID=4232 RepID=A0A251UFH4_HELAN|nr:kynurenine--oxoglutarate transaminase 1 isoform X1 [Helianthus annuus]KAF5801030.1 putative aminotransferase, class I/classII, pyridoxal phosphate-dependent transferase, major [Helianthus annuus]KAJ0565337.1 putative aminotransferase, class-I, pyridoxal-phosphate-binding, aminotransferase, class I/classII [Helianthus annuus]KAJ0572334.1 putative aminotransferase, class-I, pyridoxal-phosphate-binding, aminotransferase, class I/classII [Helianthus annuus]KAJ0736785.1 putative aminotransferase,